MTEAKYLITLNNLRGHTYAGVTQTSKNYFGFLYREGETCDIYGYWCPMFLHETIMAKDRPMGSYNPLVDLLGHKELGGKSLLYLTDGLYSGVSQKTEATPIIFDSEPFDHHWSSSILASLDPVALDSVGYDILSNEINQSFSKIGCVDNYLHEAALADDPPSKTTYSPSGEKLESLGVHEHWNNPHSRQYNRNLGEDKGIELVYA